MHKLPGTVSVQRLLLMALIWALISIEENSWMDMSAAHRPRPHSEEQPSRRPTETEEAPVPASSRARTRPALRPPAAVGTGRDLEMDTK